MRSAPQENPPDRATPASQRLTHARLGPRLPPIAAAVHT